MGSQHARIISESSSEVLTSIFDPDDISAKQLVARYGGNIANHFEELFECDAVILASPTSVHNEQAHQLLMEKVPLLVEKPLSVEFEEVAELCSLAKNNQTVLMCGFVERFNPSVQLAMDLCKEENVIHITAQRHSPFDSRKLGNVVHDLLIHDIDLTLRLMNKGLPTEIFGSSWHSSNGLEEISDCTLKFDDESLGSLSSSRMSHRKIRTLSVLTESKLIEVDLLRADVTVYRNVRQELQSEASSLTYRSETIIDIPFVRHSGEPLASEHRFFFDLIRGESDPNQEINSILPPHSVASEIEEQCNRFSSNEDKYKP